MDQKRIWIYCRVARSGQNDRELLEGQRLLLERCAGERGYEITGASYDIGSSLTLDRPGLLPFWDAVDKGAVDGLLLLNLARLGRDMNQVFLCWRMLSGRGVHIHTIADGEIDLGFRAMLQEIVGK